MTRAFFIALTVLAAASPAQAQFALFNRPLQTRAFYYPVPVVLVPAPQPPAVVFYADPVYVLPPSAPAPPAVPQPSPPSSGLLRPPPAAKPLSPPVINEESARSMRASTSFYEAYPTANAPPSRTAGRFSVTFWNLSGTPMSLRVGGQVRSLGQGQRLTLDLDREFEWRVEGHESQLARVPEGEQGLTLLIRR
jgi:hypothetical protein